MIDRPHVLVVEDDPDTREMFCRFLEMEGYDVESASNGQQALDRLTGGMEACVIVLDLMMPVMDGWQFRREQVRHADLARIPVIVVSAAGRERMERLDVDEVLAKPVDLDYLLERVSAYCRAV